MRRDREAERVVRLVTERQEREAAGDESEPEPVLLLKGRDFFFSLWRREWEDFFSASEVRWRSDDGPLLPRFVPCVLTYPLSTPYLFLIDAEQLAGIEANRWINDGRGGVVPVTTTWSLDGICNAIADAYEDVYARPQDFGIWGHDMGDLVIEELRWYPDLNVLWPGIGS